jgi:N-acetylneuraminate lyase
MDKLELIAAVFSPFADDGELALDKVDQQIERLIDDRVDGAFVCGTTGEGSSLDTTERKQLATAWQEKVVGRLKVMVHVGHASLRDATDLAAHAQSIGADSVAVRAPYLLKPASADDVVACLEQISRAAPNIGLYYYHIPMLTNFGVPPSEIVERAKQKISNFAGVKFTDDNLTELARLHHQLGVGNVYFGRDDLMTQALQIGVRGAVGMSYNFAGKHLRRLFDAYTHDRIGEVEALQADVGTLLSLAMRHGLTNVLKAISAMGGVDCGPSRLPLRTIGLRDLNSIVQDKAAKAAVQRLLS